MKDLIINVIGWTGIALFATGIIKLLLNMWKTYPEGTLITCGFILILFAVIFAGGGSDSEKSDE